MDDRPTTCAHCGAPPGTGRFCTNCGAPFDSVPMAPSPPTHTSVVPGLPAYDEPEPRRSSRAASLTLGLGMAAILVALLAGGGWLLLHGGGSSAATTSPPLVPRSHHPKPTPSKATHTPEPTLTPTPSSTASPRQQGPAADVAGLSRASAPAHAPAGVDLNGQPVTFVPANLVDGARETCWRAPGNATGTVLTFRLDQPTRLTRVGLVNGYAKTAYAGGRTFDWYEGDRRVLAVDWLFDDGSSVSQLFSATRAMQTIDVPPVTTSTVQLRITAVTPPGQGPAARDDTAVSEVSLVGSTA